MRQGPRPLNDLPLGPGVRSATGAHVCGRARDCVYARTGAGGSMPVEHGPDSPRPPKPRRWQPWLGTNRQQLECFRRRKASAARRETFRTRDGHCALGTYSPDWDGSAHECVTAFVLGMTHEVV